MTLRRAYDEIMDKVEVTEEMRRRVLARIAQADIAPARPKVLRFPAWKKYLSAAACLVLVIAGAAVLPRLLTPAQPNPPPIVMVPPTVEEAASLQELSELVGFEVETGFALPFDVTETTYRAYLGELAEVAYSDANQIAVFRQSAGTGDNSGDYTVYSDVTKITAGGLPVTLKGDGGTYVLAVWTDGAFSYSLRLSQGVPEAEWLAVLASR